MNYRQKTCAFLEKNGLFPGNLDFTGLTESFIREMENGLSGKSSLKMIPTYIQASTLRPAGKNIIVLDAGGTNFRAALLSFDHEGKADISHFGKYPMPGTRGILTKNEFFREMAELIEKTVPLTESVAFCFSYPSEILPNRDGRLIHFCKEVKAPEVENTLIGESLKAALQERGYKISGNIIILNDTVATLLGGIYSGGSRRFSSYIGLILGTGTNTCYIEKGAAIKKIRSFSDMIINIESGAYDQAPRGALDLALDERTETPGQHVFEKMISGAYLGPLVLLAVKQAAEEGLFTSGAAAGINRISSLETADLDCFLNYPFEQNRKLASEDFTDHDRSTFYIIAGQIIERAAFLTAANISAAVLKTGAGTDPDLPVCIAAEGTTFFSLKNLRFLTEYYCRKYLTGHYQRFIEIIRPENSTLIGTALAGLEGSR
ncbi:MAG: hypothetical protein A2096_15875 [Spirochaetes bacterium GWF1_41_5]|nr:MAG: hypothetical protein A2096_15875 [Spirochaetes bacterium GWF1_41_5]HBE03091.1 hexokinase [Spirochaetia bacterium]